MRLVIDLRRAFDSGLGTYIRHVVPASVAQLHGVQATGLIAPGDENKHQAYWGGTQVAFQPIAAAPLGLAEQWLLRGACPPGAVFWATTLSHALLSTQRLVATVHDVAQLALPASSGISPAVRWASHAYFSSLRHRAELLLFNSHTTSTEFKHYVGLTQAATVVTPLGVDVDEWRPLSASVPSPMASITGGAPYFLWLGNLRPHKNLPLLLAAFEEVSTSLPHHLVVVGRARRGLSPKQSLSHMPERLRARVHALGEVDAAALPGVMQHACALVMPSLYEGFGLPMLEAFAAGCVVIASDIAAHREVGGQTDNQGGSQTALFFDPLDHDSLARLLLQVAQESAACHLARVAAGLVRARALSWRTTATLTAVALQGAMSARPPHPQRAAHRTS
jgi:glycosyltransferase involved in cell wall biosynthesis